MTPQTQKQIEEIAGRHVGEQENFFREHKVSPLWVKELIKQALTEIVAPLEKDRDRLNWIQKNHFTILACWQPKTFMITSLGKEGGVSEDLRQAIDSAITASQTKENSL